MKKYLKRKISIFMHKPMNVEMGPRMRDHFYMMLKLLIHVKFQHDLFVELYATYNTLRLLMQHYFPE